MAKSIEEYKLCYELLSIEELLGDLAYKVACIQKFISNPLFMEERCELGRQIKAIKAVIIERAGGNDHE